ncbi:MAG: sel1 repeat family protein [Azonexaceae bacterium]|nr:sel1 repeat family protein [Azonexaceae bacterium]
MPPSIFKYVDIARLVGAGLKCPTCNGTDCRHSRWHSKQEKLGSAGFRPYRCNDCTHRFLARDNAAVERLLINGTAALLLCFGVWVVADLWLESVDQPKVVRVVQAAATLPEEGATGAPARLPAGGVAAEASDDPARRAQKQQEAAENGDAGAMLQFGRDLATGNNRPKDVAQAVRWVQLAAATGNPEAMLELGRFYRDGVGVTPDSTRAYVWLTRAADARHTDAVLEREALVRTMGEEPLKVAKEMSLPISPAATVIRPK